jgi:hypothetical protein
MKKLFTILALFFFIATASATDTPFYRKTANKPIRKMNYHNVQKVRSGQNLYKRNNRTGKMETTMRISRKSSNGVTVHNPIKPLRYKKK